MRLVKKGIEGCSKTVMRATLRKGYMAIRLNNTTDHSQNLYGELGLVPKSKKPIYRQT